MAAVFQPFLLVLSSSPFFVTPVLVFDSFSLHQFVSCRFESCRSGSCRVVSRGRPVVRPGVGVVRPDVGATGGSALVYMLVCLCVCVLRRLASPPPFFPSPPSRSSSRLCFLVFCVLCP